MRFFFLGDAHEPRLINIGSPQASGLARPPRMRTRTLPHTNWRLTLLPEGDPKWKVRGVEIDFVFFVPLCRVSFTLYRYSCPLSFVVKSWTLHEIPAMFGIRYWHKHAYQGAYLYSLTNCCTSTWLSYIWLMCNMRLTQLSKLDIIQKFHVLNFTRVCLALNRVSYVDSNAACVSFRWGVIRSGQVSSIDPIRIHDNNWFCGWKSKSIYPGKKKKGITCTYTVVRSRIAYWKQTLQNTSAVSRV